MGVIGEHLVDVLATGQDPVAAIARRPEHLGHAGGMQLLDREVEILVDAGRVVDVEVVDEVRRNVRRYR